MNIDYIWAYLKARLLKKKQTGATDVRKTPEGVAADAVHSCFFSKGVFRDAHVYYNTSKR
jgi:hypothetical protein